MRYFSNSGLFAAAIFVFLLPFLEFRCTDGSKFGSMNGYQLAFGQGMTFENPEHLEYIQSSEEFAEFEGQYKQPNYFSVVALIVLAAGLVIQMVLKSRREPLSILLAGISLAVLLAFKSAVSHVWAKSMEEMGPMKAMFPLKLQFGIGLWLAIALSGLLIVLNGYFLWLNRRNSYLEVYSPDDSKAMEAGSG